VGPTSPFAGSTLSETALRGRTGATVVAISRGEDVVLVPDGHEVLEAGDVLALAGTTEAVEAARLLLEGGSPDATADQPLSASTPAVPVLHVVERRERDDERDRRRDEP
jgi:CPA2 family monovalent cation:H+ antiporter-2